MARHLKLIIDVAYEHEDGTPLTEATIDDLCVGLHDAADHLGDQGRLTPDTVTAVVTEWHATVEVL